MSLTFALFAPVFFLLLVLIIYLAFKVRDAFGFMQAANQLTAPSIDELFQPGDVDTIKGFIDETRHIDICPGDFLINVPNGPFTSQYPACMGCYEAFWKDRGAVIDKRGAPALKRIGPEGVAV